ncbi:hypothetical protein [Phycicoccus duodecadis]|uniref:DUF4386 family protein n=1 Tax=Phycicoccus duodecadis TaxID=173053 RepID=A0A2N3YM95_9MICO|nr:hypothetical protein [Phycicoccus duodecadis]PKW27987.1 hypothetical protein ATL31_2840 [Phycicoccus duodecadis]
MSAATIRHVGPALCLAAFPLLLLTAEALAPWHGAADSEAQTLARAASQAGATNLADLLSFLGILLAVPGFLVVMRLTRGRAPAASLAGGALAIAGYVAGMLQVVSDQYDVLLSPLAGSSSVSDALTSSRAWALPIVLVVFLAGMLLGPVVLGVALWRSHAAPAWTGPALAASSVAGLLSHVVDLKAVDLAGLALLALAALAVAGRALRAGDDSGDHASAATTRDASPLPAA